jgi:hypothetical protein
LYILSGIVNNFVRDWFADDFRLGENWPLSASQPEWRQAQCARPRLPGAGPPAAAASACGPAGGPSNLAPGRDLAMVH